MAELTSAAVPAIGSGDHVRGEGEEVLIYMDFGCPRCAAVWAEIHELPLRLCLRHFPLASKHPRAPALHAAAEAAANQGAFWEMCDSLFYDRGHVDDPHLWERAERFGLDRGRFRADIRSDAVAERVRRDFESGISAGVSGTPTAFVGSERIAHQIRAKLGDLARG
jgi:protein-disulfide isomerase